MKHFRLLFMTLFLCLGTAVSWAIGDDGYYHYRVIFERGAVQGGYTIRNTGVIKSKADAYELISTNAIGNATTCSSYIQARTVTGNNASFYVDTNDTEMGFDGVIYINYKYKNTVTPQSWNDGNFTYSNIYTMTENRAGTIVSKIYLGDDKVAVSLKLSSKEITEDATYYRYRYYDYYYGWVYCDLNGTALINQENGNAAANRYPLADDLTTRLNGSVTVINDQSEDEFADKITYTYKSTGDWVEYNTLTDGTKFYRKAFYYSKKHKVGVSEVQNVTIPAKYGTKDVVAIQKWGFCYGVQHTSYMPDCLNKNQQTNNDYLGPDPQKDYFADKTGTIPMTNDHSNQYLKTVTFENPSNLKSIGDYAFMSCTALESVNLPNTLKYIGQGVFEQDESLNNITFQTTTFTRGEGDDAKTIQGIDVPNIRNYTFWMCTAIQSLNLPDGIVFIEGQSSGAAMQYMTSLRNLRLPNTLERVGPHFLCSAQSLETVTIPVSVTYLDGACFHGCESLRKVYILGPAATLKDEDPTNTSGSAATTFSSNGTCCADPVHDCTFFTTAGNLEGYQKDPVWSRIDNDSIWDVKTKYDSDLGKYIIDDANSKFGNALVAMGENRIIPDYWVSALFPHTIADCEAEFGEGTLVAEMEKCTHYTTEVIKIGDEDKTFRVYHLYFKLLPTKEIPRNTPVLIKAGVRQTTPYEFYTADDQKESWFETESTIDFGYDINYKQSVVEAKDKAKIYMIGRYLGHKLENGSFYFSYRNKKENADGSVTPGQANFYVVTDQDHAPFVNGCRCWWVVEQNNMRSTQVSAKPASQRFFDDETTGIDNIETKVVIDAIYDLNGHKLNVKPEELPQGMFIINGKKVINK